MDPAQTARRIIAIVDKYAMPWNRKEMADEIQQLLCDIQNETVAEVGRGVLATIDRTFRGEVSDG